MDVAQFTAEVYRQLDLAIQKYDLPITRNMVKVSCDVRGLTAGWARKINSTRYELRFNVEAIEKHTEEMVNDTIPHEVAHIVCFVRPALGRNHDAGWKAVCRALGGDDSRTHDMQLTPAKVVNRHKYKVNGREITVGPKVHSAIQRRSRNYFVKATKDPILPEHWVGSTNPPPVQQASGTRTPSPSQGLTKREMAESIFAANPTATRAEMIRMFMAQAGMTKAGAATYYYNIKNGK